MQIDELWSWTSVWTTVFCYSLHRLCGLSKGSNMGVSYNLARRLDYVQLVRMFWRWIWKGWVRAIVLALAHCVLEIAGSWTWSSTLIHKWNVVKTFKLSTCAILLCQSWLMTVSAKLLHRYYIRLCKLGCWTVLRLVRNYRVWLLIFGPKECGRWPLKLVARCAPMLSLVTIY